MTKVTSVRRWRAVRVATLVAAIAAGCTLQDATPPLLQGPSVLGLSLSLSAVPDVLTQDGASQARVTIQALDANGQPARNVSLRVDTVVSGILADFGSLSARTLVTDNNGRAIVIYTAPRSPSGGIAIDTGQTVVLQVTPFGSDFANTIPRTVTIRLMPPGVLLPGVPNPSFTFLPATPQAGSDVVFDASGTTAAPLTDIISFSWDFGDGSTGSGVRVTHRFTVGTFTVRLTVTDSNNIPVSTERQVPVSTGPPPVAAFSFSPTAPTVGQTVIFNGSESTAGTGRSIVRYDWHLGTGSDQTGVIVSRSYGTAATYSIVLTVTDDVGQTATATQTLEVAPPVLPTSVFSFSPTQPSINQPVNFNGTASTTPSGTTITSYVWDFGDGATGAGSTVSHSYTAAGTYVVRLTVTNSAGNSGSSTQSFVVNNTGAVLSASFSFSPSNPGNGNTVFFNGSASSPASAITSYAWDFGDGTTATGVTVSHVFTVTASRTFVVRLTVTDTAGRTATSTQSVPVSFP